MNAVAPSPTRIIQFDSAQSMRELHASNPRLAALAYIGYLESGYGYTLALFDAGKVYAAFIPRERLSVCVAKLNLTAGQKQELRAALDRWTTYNPANEMILISAFTKGQVLVDHVDFGEPRARDNALEFARALLQHSKAAMWEGFNIILLGPDYFDKLQNELLVSA